NPAAKRAARYAESADDLDQIRRLHATHLQSFVVRGRKLPAAALQVLLEEKRIAASDCVENAIPCSAPLLVSKPCSRSRKTLLTPAPSRIQCRSATRRRLRRATRANRSGCSATGEYSGLAGS